MALPISERAFEQVALQIRQSIVAGELLPGDKLAPERELAKRFDVGRNAVREALRDLESKGIVRLEKGRSGGAFVRPPNASRVTNALADLVDLGSLRLEDLTEARVLFMAMVVRLACERVEPAHLALLERNVEETDELTRSGNHALRIERIGEFYTLLADATGNSVLVLIATSLSAIVRGLLDQIPDSPGEGMSTTVASRRRFLRLLRARDGDGAVAEMNDHLARLHHALARKARRKA